MKITIKTFLEGPKPKLHITNIHDGKAFSSIFSWNNRAIKVKGIYLANPIVFCPIEGSEVLLKKKTFDVSGP